MPGFPFGTTRPNARAGAVDGKRFLVARRQAKPAPWGSVRGSGRLFVKKGIVDGAGNAGREDLPAGIAVHFSQCSAPSITSETGTNSIDAVRD